jgi:hypothetical protein
LLGNSFNFKKEIMAVSTKILNNNGSFGVVKMIVHFSKNQQPPMLGAETPILGAMPPSFRGKVPDTRGNALPGGTRPARLLFCGGVPPAQLKSQEIGLNPKNIHKS